MTFNKSLLSGSTTLLILQLLEKEDMYGYQMVKELERQSEQAFQLKEGTLYPVLHGLEKEGYVVAYLSQGDNGRKRKYYQITREGKKELADKKAEWEKFSRAIYKVIGGMKGATQG